MSTGPTDWVERVAQVAQIGSFALQLFGWPGIGWVRRRWRVSPLVLGLGAVGLVVLGIGAVWLWGWRGAWPVVAGGVVGVSALAYRSRDRLREWVRRGYVKSVVVLARPVRGEVREALWAELASGVPEEVWRRVRGVSGRGPLAVLLCALVACRGKEPGSGCEVIGWEVPSDAGQSVASVTRRLDKGCKVWKMREVFSDYVFLSGPAAQVWLAEDVWEADQEGALSRLVREELEKRAG